MRHTTTMARLRILIPCTLALITGVNCAAAILVLRYGSMPHTWAGWSQVSVGPLIPGHPTSLGGVVGQVQHEVMPTGGPQGFECYTYDDHPMGMTRLTMGCIGNVELAGTGRTIEVRPVQSGGIISGPGDVDEWTAYTVHRPTERRAGQLKRFNAIKFGNGWTFVEEGDQLFLCPPRGKACRAF